MLHTLSIRAIVALLLAGMFAACSGTQRPPTREELDDAEKPDEWREREAQSDFLDIGKQAGIEWLSFVQNDQREYPEYFEGLDRDQKRRLRLAPKEDATNRVLLEFKLPKGSRLWPVDWYGTELMALDRSKDDAWQHSAAIAVDTGDSLGSYVRKLAEARGGRVHESKPSDLGFPHAFWSAETDKYAYIYAVRRVTGRVSRMLLVVEVRVDAGSGTRDFGGAERILDSISIKRELALEGSPKHKCSSSMDELLRGTLHFPGGTLNLPLTDGYIARKIGGDSTVQIDGEGASPWLLLRRLDDSGGTGDTGLKQRIRADTTFKRRRDVPSARFEAGRIHKAALPIVSFDYRDSTAEQQALGVIAFGTELFTLEVISRGVTDGDARRSAREKAIALLQGATGTAAEHDLQPLEGWMPSE